jgi:hypothetical protein
MAPARHRRHDRQGDQREPGPLVRPQNKHKYPWEVDIRRKCQRYARGRGELAARGQLRTPSGEQLLDLLGRSAPRLHLPGIFNIVNEIGQILR